MAVVKMHEASDGTLHKTFEAFARHEGKLKIEKAVADASFNMDAFFVNEDAGSDDKVLSEEKIGSFIIDNADALRVVLAAGNVPQRGRKAA